MNEVHGVLDELAHAFAETVEVADGTGRQAAAAVISDLEDLAGAPLGAVRTESSILGRRFSRAHRILLDATPRAELVARLRHDLGALRDPFAATVAAWGDWREERQPVAC